MAQMKGQIKTPEKELNEMEMSKMSEAEFKTLVIRMLRELSEGLSSIKKTQSEMKDRLFEIKNNLQGNNSRVDAAENQINDLEHKEAKNHQSQQEKRIQKNEGSVSGLWDNFKRSNICLIGVPEREEEEQENWKFEKIMKENFPNLVKEIDMQVQEAQSPQQGGCKEVPSKSHDNENAKGYRQRDINVLCTLIVMSPRCHCSAFSLQ